MTAHEPLVLVGAGGFARETAEVVRAINAASSVWDLLGFADDDPARHGQEIDGIRVIGSSQQVLDEHPNARVVVCTGSPANYFSRKRIVRRLAIDDDRYARLVHPMASVPASATLGCGTVVLATTVLTSAVVVGSHVALMPGVVLTHDDVIESFVTFGAGVRVAGGVRIAEGAYIGSGALIREQRAIGAWSLVGMGSVVTRDVPPAEVWVGSPARCVRPVDVPDDVRA